MFVLMSVSSNQLPTFNGALVSNWEEQALENLEILPDELRKHKSKRCMKLNNYWCLKNVNGGWKGSIGNDSDNHAAFRSSEYAARAAVRNFRTAYFKHNRKSALEIMSAYAPNSDCIGSNAAKANDGSCLKGYNNSENYARYVIVGINDDINSDLYLFDQAGKPNEKVLITFLKNLSSVELANIKATSEIIKKGICLESNYCEANQVSKTR